MPANDIIPTPGTNLPPTFRTPAANTNHPLTEWRCGNATTTPPSQYATVPSRSVQHQTPVTGLSVKSLPASDFFGHLGCLAAARDRHAHPFFQSFIGCQPLQRFRMFVRNHQTRTPPSRIAGSASACSNPSTVNSATKPLPAKADRGRKTLKRVTPSTDRYRRALRWCRHYEIGAHPRLAVPIQ